MREGVNPNSSKKIQNDSTSHRIIIPIYIPNFQGYFKDSLNVLKVCITSLLKTVNTDTAITLISNASCNEVNEYLNSLKKEDKIDKVVFNKNNVGKMNAIISETRASFEEYITFSDADVFFDKGWLKETFLMFQNVPKAGYVSMNPTPQNFAYAESTILDNLYALLFNKQKTSNICSFEDLEHFHKSIGRNIDSTKEMLNKKIFCLKKYNYIIGAGHFCCTIKKTETLKQVPLKKSNIAASGGSEAIYLDIPFNKTGLWKLSSPKAYVWHMGNVLEKEWSNKKLENLTDFVEDSFAFNNLINRKKINFIKFLPYKFRIFLVKVLRKFKVLV